MASWLSLLVFLALSFAAAASGAFFRPGEWYASLVKPSWTPPNYVFGPVWSALYVMMAIAAWLVWTRTTGRSAVLPMALFGTQLILNGLWSFLFFGLRRQDWAFVDVTALWLTVIATAVSFFTIERMAGLLLVPYAAWLTYAAALNLAIWRLNAT